MRCSLYKRIACTYHCHMSTPTYAPIEAILELWRSGSTLQEIAAECGVSRQRISQRLIEAGFSPAERRAQTIAAREANEHSFKAQRAESLARRAEAREDACDRLQAMADELGVAVTTLGQYATRSGAYATRRTGKHPQAVRYGKGTLPARDTPEGEGLAATVAAAVAPWSAMHLSNIASRRPRID